MKAKLRSISQSFILITFFLFLFLIYSSFYKWPWDEVSKLQTRDFMRFSITLIILTAASIQDFKSRQVYNYLPWSAYLVGSIFFLYEYFIIENIVLPAMFLFSSVMAYVFSRALIELGLIGSADGKIFLGISFIYYRAPPHLEPQYFPLAVFSTALLISLIVPLSLFCYNIFSQKKISLKDFFLYFNGYKRQIKEVRWYERVIDDTQLISFFVDNNTDIMTSRTSLDNKKIVWVSPVIPFLIPLTIGFIFSFFRFLH